RHDAPRRLRRHGSDYPAPLPQAPRPHYDRRARGAQISAPDEVRAAGRRGAGAPPAEARLSRGGTMRIHRLYTDRNGESHFQDVEVEYAETTRAGKLSKRIPATGIIFREVQPDYDLEWPPAPRREYIITVEGGVQIPASGGGSRRIGGGEVLLVEDPAGRGHLSKAIEGRVRTCIFVPREWGGRPGPGPPAS